MRIEAEVLKAMDLTQLDMVANLRITIHYKYSNGVGGNAITPVDSYSNLGTTSYVVRDGVCAKARTMF